MIIRKLEVKDIDRIIKLEMEAFNESLGYDILHNAVTSSKLARYLVIEINSEVIGYIASIVCEGVAEIYNFLIDKVHQSKGYGRQLLEYYLNDLKSQKMVSCSLEVKETNTKAIHLYESFGFKTEHIRKNYYKDNTNALLLVKRM